MLRAIRNRLFGTTHNRGKKQASPAQVQPIQESTCKQRCVCTMCGVCEYWALDKGPFHPDSYGPMPQLIPFRDESDCILLREYPNSTIDVF